MCKVLTDVHVSSSNRISKFMTNLSTNVFFHCQHSLVLESLLFDFSASMVERAVRLLDERINFEDLVPTIQELMKRYPYEKQKRYDPLK